MKNLRKILPPLSSLLPFEAAARLGSITRAGEELGLTQAAVSKQIRALEENLGRPLFERRNRAVHLTRAGRAYGAGLTEALRSIAELSRDLRAESRQDEVVLRSQLCEGLYWLMPRLSRFYERHPTIPVRVSVSTKPLGQAEESFDLALQTEGRDPGDAELVFTATDRVYPVCSPRYLESLATPLSIAGLPSYRLLHHRVEPQDWLDWDRWLAQLGIDLQVGAIGTFYDSYPMMVQAALEGHGIALGWQRTVEHHMACGALVRPFATDLYVPDALAIYRPGKRSQRPGAAALLAWLESELI
ncbi:MAG TPA: LysR substrate-binding domain-containing protein [Kiloniellaceae bacterium]|nr:LysR substrate-binding domain-containing protein [Kiloniellaceae bacterium]